VRLVVDSGLRRASAYDPAVGMAALARSASYQTTQPCRGHDRSGRPPPQYPPPPHPNPHPHPTLSTSPPLAVYQPISRCLPSQVTRPISIAAADQRAGRAGRVAPGTAYRLWGEDEHRRLEPQVVS
jgi:hypothetical protein